MTDVRIDIRVSRCVLTATGHATGSERVCAGSSAIIYALAGWLANHPGKCRGPVQAEMAPGRAEIVCEPASPDVFAAFEMAAIGLLQIQDRYRGFITVDYAKTPLVI